jgi:hypothetical protein
MLKNILSRSTQWILKWINANIKFGSILGRAKRRALEKQEQYPGPEIRSSSTKEQLFNQRSQLYSIKELADSLPPGKSQNYYWDKLIETLQNLGRQSETFQVGKYYTFKYWAKTKGKYFDLYPVSIIIDRQPFSVLGVNLHWKNAPQYVESMYRTYNYTGFQSRFYEIKEWELEDVMRIATFYPIKL